MNTEYLIIGQGLAGSLIAWQLQQQGKDYFIIDNASANAASRVGAGLITPITGKRLVKSPDLKLFLSAAKPCYEHIEQCLGEVFFHDRPMLRLLQSQQETEQYELRASDSKYQPYIDSDKQCLNSDHISLTSHGGFCMKEGAYLDSGALIDKLGNYFMSKGAFRHEHIDYNDIKLDSKQAHYKEITADNVIFCEGHAAINNPWFSWLPFALTKGEIIDCHIETPIPDTILHSGKWILPIDEKTVRCGATFDWTNLDLQPSIEAREQLSLAFEKILPNTSIAIIDQQVGIRSGTRDRQPFIGIHPEFRQLSIFNGFGSKGALLIPFYSVLFSKILSGQSTSIHKVDIARYL